MTAPPPKKDYEKIAAQMRLDSAIAQILDGGPYGRTLSFNGPSPRELQEKDEQEAAAKAEAEREAVELARSQSKEAMLTARMRIIERKIAKTKKKLARAGGG